MKPRKTRAHPESGFTLLEMLIVIGIIALIAAISAPQVLKYLGRAKSDAAKTQIQYIANALDLYFLDTGEFPSSSQGLNSLMQAPPAVSGWDGPYLRDASGLVDPWGADYIYQQQDSNAAIVSTFGADGVAGGDGANRDLRAKASLL